MKRIRGLLKILVTIKLCWNDRFPLYSQVRRPELGTLNWLDWHPETWMGRPHQVLASHVRQSTFRLFVTLCLEEKGLVILLCTPVGSGRGQASFDHVSFNKKTAAHGNVL